MKKVRRMRDGHSRLMPAAAEFTRLRERAMLSQRQLAAKVAPRVDDVSEGAVRLAISRLEAGNRVTVREDVYEAALGLIREAILDRSGELNTAELSLLSLAHGVPYLHEAEDDLHWHRETIAEAEAALAALRLVERGLVERAEDHRRRVADKRAELRAATA